MSIALPIGMLAHMPEIVITLAALVFVAAVVRVGVLLRRLVRLRTSGRAAVASPRDLAAVRSATFPADMVGLAAGKRLESVATLRRQTGLTPRQCLLALDLARSGEL